MASDSKITNLADLGAEPNSSDELVLHDSSAGDTKKVSKSDLLGNYIKQLKDDSSPQLGGDLDLNGNNLDFPSTKNISDVLDENDLASNSSTALATQSSIKSYVDNNASGAEIDLDLGNDNSLESSDLSEIATTGDTNNIFTKSTADKLLIDASKNWPTSDTTAADVETLSTSLTSGSIPFSNGSNLAENNSSLYWDNQNDRLGIGTSSPSSKLDVNGTIRTAASQPYDAIKYANTDNSNFYKVRNTGGGSLYWEFNNGSSYQFAKFNSPKASDALVVDSSGNVNLGNSSPNNQLTVSGNADITGNLGINTSTPNSQLTVSGNAELTAGNKLITAESSQGDVLAEFDTNGSNNNKFQFVANPSGNGVLRLNESINNSTLVDFRNSKTQFVEDIGLNSDLRLDFGNGNESALRFDSGLGDLILDYDRKNQGTINYKIQRNGNNVLVADSNQNIGIGTSNPSSKLDVENSGASVTPVHITNLNATNGDTSSLAFRFQDSNSNELTGVSLDGVITDVTDSSENGQLRLQTVEGGSLSEAMRVDGGGVSLDGGTTTIGSSELNLLDGLTNNLADSFWKGFSVEDSNGLTNSENIKFFYTDRAITIQKVEEAIQGSSTPSIDYNIQHASARDSGTPNSVFSSNQTASSTSGNERTTFSDATIPADSYIWITTSSVSGTVTELNLDVEFTID